MNTVGSQNIMTYDRLFRSVSTVTKYQQMIQPKFSFSFLIQLFLIKLSIFLTNCNRFHTISFNHDYYLVNLTDLETNGYQSVDTLLFLAFQINATHSSFCITIIDHGASGAIQLSF